ISLFSKDLSVVGDIKGKGALEIEGKVSGNITGNIVTLRESAVVDGEIFAQVVNIKGKFSGSIKAEKIAISGKANVDGKMEYMLLTVEDGASILGELKRSDKVNLKVAEKAEEKVETKDSKDLIKKSDIKSS
ncbi:MAG: polymer-forming cytoskeletal protein, partial [Rickettsiales bacterium]|nr:polymer-forming cytoskeletal protein [Rickettsiales bacterium]